MPDTASDGLLGLTSVWQVLVLGLFVVVIAVGLLRLAQRGPGRVTNVVFLTGFLIVAITVVGTLAVSCEGPSDRSAQTPQRR